MSMKTWIEKYYPVEAKRCPVDEALAHSLRKWEGLRPDARAEHGVTLLGASLDDGYGALEIASDSCALCQHYFDNDAPVRRDVDEESQVDHACSSCPLAKARGGVPCDEPMEGEERSPYAAACYGPPEKRTVEPMIYWLTLAVRREGQS